MRLHVSTSSVVVFGQFNYIKHKKQNYNCNINYGVGLQTHEIEVSILPHNWFWNFKFSSCILYVLSSFEKEEQF